MDVILKVLEGAKSGTKIAVKKDEFLVGRSQQCHLCAGSSSVSRRHCAITRKDATVSIKDLGSRNGTLVNDKKISAEVELASGDEIGIGTLKLLVTITHGITNLKRPKVKTVADAVERTVSGSDSSVHEEDITQWLLDAPGPSSSKQVAGHQAASETQTIRMDDTNAVQLRDKVDKQDSEKQDSEKQDSETHDVEKQDQSASSSAKSSVGSSTADGSAVGSSTADGSAVGSSAGKGRHEESSSAEPGTATSAEETAKVNKQDAKKKPPGKLPPRPNEPGSKDSREAAMQALRNWNRRR